MNNNVVVPNPILNLLRNKLRAVMNTHEQSILEKACRTYDEYANQTGILEGLRLAERELLDLSRRLDANDFPDQGDD